MSWFKDNVDDWDMVGKTLAPIPPSVDWDDEEDEKEEEEIVVPLTGHAQIDLVTRDPNAELLKKLKAETEKLITGG